MDVLKFTDQRMLVASVTARSEVHGAEREPASDVGLEADLSNDVLNIFHPGLKSLLYYFDKEKQRDLADQGRATEPGFLPDLRMPDLLPPLKWQGEIVNARVTIGVPGAAEKNRVVLTDAKVNNFQLTPRDGGTVQLKLRVQYHPDEKQAGKLAMLVQQEVEVTLEVVEQPPAASEE